VITPLGSVRVGGDVANINARTIHRQQLSETIITVVPDALFTARMVGERASEHIACRIVNEVDGVIGVRHLNRNTKRGVPLPYNHAFSAGTRALDYSCGQSSVISLIQSHIPFPISVPGEKPLGIVASTVYRAVVVNGSDTECIGHIHSTILANLINSHPIYAIGASTEVGTTDLVFAGTVSP